MGLFEAKVCVVMGGSFGLGRALCLRLADEGAQVTFWTSLPAAAVASELAG